MSKYTRLASTDAQEQAIATVEKAFKKAKRNIAGYTTIGKSPQTVILDVKYQGSDIYITSEGEIRIRTRIGELLWDAVNINISEIARAIEYRATLARA